MVTKKNNAKRGLTPYVEKKIAFQIQDLAGTLNRIKKNPRIESETKKVVAKMHKLIIDASSYSAKLSFLRR